MKSIFFIPKGIKLYLNFVFRIRIILRYLDSR